MRNLILALLILLCFTRVQAQNIEGQIIASQYGTFKVPGSTYGSFQFPVASCQVTGGGKNFSAFQVNVPIKIVDGNPAQTEIATPSSVFINQCSVNMSTTYVHQPPYYLTSGTGGLQEAIYANQQNNGINSIVLDWLWYRQVVPGTPSAVIASVKGITQLSLVDVTTVPYTWYRWNGSQYVVVPVGGSGAVSSVFGRIGDVVAASGDYNCNQVTGCGPQFSWTINITAAQSPTDTVLSVASIPAGLTAPGTFYIDGEYETFTGINQGSLQLTGITRGVSQTTATSHGNSSNLYSVSLAAGPNSQPPRGGFFGGLAPGLSLLATNCGTPAQTIDSGATTVFQANCGSSATYIDSAGRIHQNALSNITNFLSPIYIGNNSVDTVGNGGQPILLANSTNIAQTNGSYEFGLPMGFASAIYGQMKVTPTANLPAPTLNGPGGGSCNITYEIVGTDPDGASIPGATASISSLQSFGSGGAVSIQVPLVAGIVSYVPYRTAVSGCGVAVGKFTAANTNAYPFFVDTGQTGDGTTPPSTNTSVAKSCVGSVANPELFCTLSGASATPPLACSGATSGWTYQNTAATASPYEYHCYSASSSWTPVTGGGGGSGVTTVFGRGGAVTAQSGDYTVSQVTGAAPLASPALTGSPTAPTQTAGDNSTKIATTAYVTSNSPVTSAFGRTGAIVATNGDYSVNQVTGAAPAGLILYAQNYAGNAGAQINACNNALITAGGGTCDDRAVLAAPGAVATTEISIGDTTQTSMGITHMLPASMNLTITFSNAALCGFRIYSGATLEGTSTGGGGNRAHVFAGSGSTMHALLCTDTGQAFNSYVKVGNLALYNTSGATMPEVVDIEDVVDQSWFHDFYAQNNTGDAWLIGSACCGAAFDRIQGFASPGTPYSTGGRPLVVGGGVGGTFVQAITVRDSSFNRPKSGQPDIDVLNGAIGLTCINCYAEGNGDVDTTTPMVKIESGVNSIEFLGGMIQPLCTSACAGKYSFRNDSSGTLNIFGVVQGNGSFMNDVANSVTVPGNSIYQGNNYVVPSLGGSLPNAPGVGYAPVSTASGTGSYTAQAVALASKATCSQNSAKGIFTPDCYSSTGSGATLVSQADAAFNAAVSYMAANSAGATVDLGSKTWNICNNQQGWVIPQASSGTSSGLSIVGDAQLNVPLNLTCQINRTALPSGAQSGSPISQAALWMPIYASPVYTSMHWANFAVYANTLATFAADIEGTVFVSSFEHLVFSGGSGDGTSLATEFRLGNSSYLSQSWVFRSIFTDVSTNGTGAQGTGAVISVSNSSGTPTFTVSTQGNNYTANTKVYILGAATASTRACFTDTPFGTTSGVPTANVTISSGHITAISNSGVFCGSGTLYAKAYDPGQAILYGVVLDHATDNDFYSLEPQTGYAAALYTGTNAGNNRFVGLHPCCGMAEGIYDNGGSEQFIGTEFDSLANYGAYLDGAPTSTFTNSSWYWNGTYAGAQGYYAGPSSVLKLLADQCLSLQSSGGYALNSTTSGQNTYQTNQTLVNEQECGTGTQITRPIPPTATSGSQYSISEYSTTGTSFGPSNLLTDSSGNNLTIPTGGTITSPTFAGAASNANATGFWQFSNGMGTPSGQTSFFNGSVSISSLGYMASTGAASGGTNFSSNILRFYGSYGSNANDAFDISNVVAAGAGNPETDITVSHSSGSTGAHYFDATALSGLKTSSLLVAGTTFSVSGCGTATSLVGGSTAGKFTGGSATCTPVVTMGSSKTATNGWMCSVSDFTTGTAAFRQTASTTTTATFTASGTVGATDVISFACIGY